MAHYGSLGSQRVSDDVRDIRSTTLRGSDGAKLGTVNDVIFDHDTMEICYLSVDSDGWLEAGTFLLPSDRVFADPSHEDGPATGVTSEQVANAPEYNKQVPRSKDAWKKYQEASRSIGTRSQSMHLKGSDRIIAPPHEPGSAPRWLGRPGCA